MSYWTPSERFVKDDQTEVILFDPQAHSDWDSKTGFWDKGKPEIDVFEAEHKCNALCRSLGLVSSDKRPAVKQPTGTQTRNRMAVENLVNLERKKGGAGSSKMTSIMIPTA
ncbi:hypothetical protein BD311DRAFT_811181 [Dichomitus squalens]|uniref:Alpha-type protein kinase domain-containing protein n=1 Tax=Dichomitus squalens TaxID=114155 RepID=A0A4Q9MAP9_9APHY|nr:hypothetical protein BD311DRAFT_811181 [Dichomitus squalens]